MSEAACVDSEYPGTAIARLEAVHARVKALPSGALSGDWTAVRRVVLLAVSNILRTVLMLHSPDTILI